MAPRKPAPETKAKKTPAAKQSKHKVIKRPARGYHKFKNGMLNVTPKGGERELVKNNQDSTLLRLPPEIRNRIWGCTLSDKEFRQRCAFSRGRMNLLIKPRERSNAFALLRTCRQIYAETALLPFALNTFSIRKYWSAGGSFKRIRKYQCSRISEVQLEIDIHDIHDISVNWLSTRSPALDLPKWLPGLRCVRIRVFDDQRWKKKAFADCENALRSILDPDMRARGYDLTVEKMNTNWITFDKIWHGTAVASNE